MKTVDFSKSIAACDPRVGRCRQLIELMKVCRHLSELMNVFKVKVFSKPWPKVIYI